MVLLIVGPCNPPTLPDLLVPGPPARTRRRPRVRPHGDERAAPGDICLPGISRPRRAVPFAGGPNWGPTLSQTSRNEEYAETDLASGSGTRRCRVAKVEAPCGPYGRIGKARKMGGFWRAADRLEPRRLPAVRFSYRALFRSPSEAAIRTEAGAPHAIDEAQNERSGTGAKACPSVGATRRASTPLPGPERSARSLAG